MSALKQRISEETKAALLGGDRFRVDVLRSIKAAILNEEVALRKREEGLGDAEVEVVIAREAKKRQESMNIYRQNDRPELADTEEREACILQEFLPKQLSEDEVRSLVQSVIAAHEGDVSMQQMGQIIGASKAKAGSSADGAVIARIVKETLST